MVFDSYPEIDKKAIKWNILHTNFKGSDWKFSRAKNDDVRQRLNYQKMVENKVFRISKDLDITDQTHSLELFVSAGYQYDEYRLGVMGRSAMRGPPRLAPTVVFCRRTVE